MITKFIFTHFYIDYKCVHDIKGECGTGGHSELKQMIGGADVFMDFCSVYSPLSFNAYHFHMYILLRSFFLSLSLNFFRLRPLKRGFPCTLPMATPGNYINIDLFCLHILIIDY